MHSGAHPPLDELASALITQGSRFARTASRDARQNRSLVAYRVLSNLHQDGALRVGELTAREGISQPAMTTTVNKLEADGLTTRATDADDARASLVTITTEGRAELAAFRQRAAAQVTPALEKLTDDELATLSRAAALLSRLTDTLQQR